MKSTVKKRLAKVRDQIQSAADEMHDIIWKVTMKDDECEALGKIVEAAEAAIDKISEQIMDEVDA